MHYQRLTPQDLALARQLNDVYAQAFEDVPTYRDHPPADAYLQKLLSKPHVIVLVALREGKVVGGITAYVLEKLEQSRSEIYLYDLAVAEAFRRQGIARALIRELQAVARSLGAWVIFVQADQVDPPAIALYESMGGVREEPFHFDIPLE